MHRNVRRTIQVNDEIFNKDHFIKLLSQMQPSIAHL